LSSIQLWRFISTLNNTRSIHVHGEIYSIQYICKICQSLVGGVKVSNDTQVSFINKNDRRVITEIVFKVEKNNKVYHIRIHVHRIHFQWAGIELIILMMIGTVRVHVN
jgi:hypothetical protein